MVTRPKSRLGSAGYHHLLTFCGVVGPWRSLGARLNGIQEVRGSNPLGSTTLLSQDIVDSVSGHRSRVLSWHWLVIASWVKGQLSQYCAVIGDDTKMRTSD